MKKITISVAALLIAMNSFGQSNDSILISKIGEHNFNLLQKIEIENTEEDLFPFLTTIPLQKLAYYSALKKGYDIDKPRNLAKSVTVE